MDKPEYHPYLTKKLDVRGTGEISRVFPRTIETHAWRPRVTCFSMREDREKLGTRNNATWRKRRIAFSEDYVLCHQLPNKSGIFDLNCLQKMPSLALWCLFATKVVTAPAKTEDGEPNWCNMLKVRYLLNRLSWRYSYFFKQSELLPNSLLCT